MKVLIADGSQVVMERLVTTMGEIPNVEPNFLAGSDSRLWSGKSGRLVGIHHPVLRGYSPDCRKGGRDVVYEWKRRDTAEHRTRGAASES